MAATDEDDAGTADVLEQAPREPGRLAALARSLGRSLGRSLARSRGVRLAATGLLVITVIGWLFLAAGVGDPDDSPRRPGRDECGSRWASACSRQLAASLYAFARNPTPATKVPWARDVALTAPGAWVVVPRSRAARRTAWTTVSGRTGEYLLADLAGSGGRYRADDTRHVDCRARARDASTPAYAAIWISVQSDASVPCSAWWAVDVFLDERHRVARVTVTTR